MAVEIVSSHELCWRSQAAVMRLAIFSGEALRRLGPVTLLLMRQQLYQRTHCANRWFVEKGELTRYYSSSEPP